MMLSAAFATCQSLLWELKTNQHSEPSYLYGTIHFSDPQVMCYCDSVELLLQKSELMMPEMMMGKNLSSTDLQLLMLPKHITLQSLIGKVDYNQLKRIVKSKFGYASTLMLNRLKPVLAMSFIESPKPSNISMDQHLQKIAEKNNIPVKGLESMEEQMNALNSMPLDVQTKMLKESIHASKSVDLSLDSLIELYRSKNIDLIAQEAGDAFLKVDSTTHTSILEKRNILMSERIFQQITQTATFIAIGAAHLGGEMGVLSLLAKKGIGIRAIACKFKNEN